MRRLRGRPILETLVFGWLYASIFAATSRDLAGLAVVSLPRWGLVLGFAAVGLLIALVVVDLRRMVLQTLAAAVVGAVIYAGFLAAPALVASGYWVRLVNHALIQASFVLLLAALLGLAGAMVGAVINSVVREIEL